MAKIIGYTLLPNSCNKSNIEPIKCKVEDSIPLEEELQRNFGFRRFKSFEQKIACQLICFSDADVLAGEKSLLFTFYALKKWSHEFTVVVVPTKALRLQISSELTKLGLIVATNFGDVNAAEVGVFTPDQLTVPENAATIHRMAGHRIKRIFVDEAHCVITEAKYRNSYRELKICEGLGYFVDISECNHVTRS
jgi:superfamily II DNA helicase RecQ